jgi:hypothetical protein
MPLPPCFRRSSSAPEAARLGLAGSMTHSARYAIMLPRNASHFRKSPKLSHVAYVERIAFPERALLELWLQISKHAVFQQVQGYVVTYFKHFLG